jgi:hypothetical protein
MQTTLRATPARVHDDLVLALAHAVFGISRPELATVAGDPGVNKSNSTSDKSLNDNDINMIAQLKVARLEIRCV